MPRRKGPALDNPIARSIFNELDLYAKDKQFYPAQNALYNHMIGFVRKPDGQLERRYTLSVGEFNYWFGRLVEEKFIEIDPPTRAIRAMHLVIVDKEDTVID